MQKFGYVSLPRLKDIHLEFNIEKLYKIICFVDRFTVKNSTNKVLYCIRYNDAREKLEEFVEIGPQVSVPFKG